MAPGLRRCQRRRKYWTAGLHLNTNSVPFIPKFDQPGEACAFILRFRWDGTVPIPGQRSYFLGAGDTQGMTYGFLAGLDESGHYYFYSSKPALKHKVWEDCTVAGHDGYSLRVTFRVRTAGNAQTLTLALNGSATPAATIEAAATDEFQTLTADIPATSLVAGDNALTLSNTAAQAGGSTWLGVDFVRTEVRFPTPMTIVIR